VLLFKGGGFLAATVEGGRKEGRKKMAVKN
jgi:hypothetical protein